eukprot:8315113-Alexandrium_andersonii.AAC.1
MSASLVGSEMCIRDRRPPRRLCAPLFRALTRRPRNASSWRPACTAQATCLLYTSDAADDM